MDDSRLASKIYYGLSCYALLYIVAAASFYGLYAKYHFAEADPNHRYGNGLVQRGGFERMVEGTADRPFVYRQLLPTIANWIDAGTPEGIKTWLFTPRGFRHMSPVQTLVDSPIATNPVYFFRYLIIYLGNFAFALIATFSIYFVSKAVNAEPQVALLAAIIFMLLYPYIESNGSTLYDLGELAFMAVALLIAIKADWWWLIPVSALGAWNKESFLFFVLTLYPFLRRRASRIATLLQIGVLAAVCFAVYWQGHLRFAHNPGGSVELHWRDQIAFFLDVRGWLVGRWPFERTNGILMVPALTILPIGLLVWSVRRAWPMMSPAMRRHAQIAAIINLPLYFMFCWPGEFRNFSLMNMSFLFVLVTNLTAWFQGFGEGRSHGGSGKIEEQESKAIALT